MSVNRGDAHVFMSSIHVVQAELHKLELSGVAVPLKALAELSAMEMVLRRDYLDGEKR